ncbi:5-(carboxyamino)imidazole ribonucleotide synthase [Caulobacter sp. S45]|uniref:5-(carboxyamino)imidazole ribonucleotide synthase n=1 Tax=Caulobacter sp. S45 TaxID=1641861 RepID=UPI00131DED47|nr:5-(carboxyamino)imidazole ribonucleotide synthase [Caulobacter sp. S45]
MSQTFAPLAPGSVIGVLGGGQLGRMLALAAARLGFDVVVLTPETDTPASRVAWRTIVADYTDPSALAELAELAAVVTYEFENVPVAAVEALIAHGGDVAPGALALATAQDRVKEKSFFRASGVPTVDFAAVDSVADIVEGLSRLGAPALLKTRREGYDGKGQTWVADAADAEAAFARIGSKPAILEARAAFRRELSVIAARGRDGVVAAYPLSENHHRDGVLRTSRAPAQASHTTRAEALRIAERTLERLDYVGVAGIELFEGEDGRLLVNEFAPRVHNSGHWTLDACQVDQFEQHVRAVAGWPLGPTDMLATAEMENLLGDAALDWAALAADPSARLWLYGKRDVAPGRKMGHLTRLGSPMRRDPEIA